MKEIHNIFALCVCAYLIYGQHPLIYSNNPGVIVIRGATIHTGTGTAIQNGMLISKDSIIVYTGNDDEEIARKYLSSHNSLLINGKGKHIYPGIIGLGAPAGLVEIDAVRATRDIGENETLAPEILAYTSYNIDSRVLPTLLTNGILIAGSTPYGGTISGRASILFTTGWTKQQALIKKIAWLQIIFPDKPILYKLPEKEREENLKKYNERISHLREIMEAARAYSLTKNPDVIDPRLEAIAPVFTGEIPLVVYANSKPTIENAIYFFKGSGVKNIVISGGAAVSHLIPLLKENNIRVLFTKIHDLPLNQEDRFDILYSTPHLLWKNNIEFCIGEDGGWGSAWSMRNLPFMAGTAVAYGLPYEEAIKAITLNCAKIAGISDKYGSIENGKSATFIITEGDLLNPPSSKILYAFINGKKVHLDDYHQYLFRRYMQKYHFPINEDTLQR